MRARALAWGALLLLPLLPGCLEGDPSPLAGDGGAGGSDGGATTTPGAPPAVSPSGQCSKGATESIAITFRNQSPTITVDILWVDYACGEVKYGTLVPGQAPRVQLTYLTHVWHVRDARNGALYKEFTPVRGASNVVDFP